MRGLSAVLILVLCVCRGALCVHVKVGDRIFPLEAVQQLEKLLDPNTAPSLRTYSRAPAVCRDPLLPQVFRPLCQEKGAGAVFAKLRNIVLSSDPCEICANPSCFGCLQ